MRNVINRLKMLLLMLAFFTQTLSSHAQQSRSLIDRYLAGERDKYGLTADDISDYLITDEYTDKATGHTYVYIQQRHNKIGVFNAISVFLIEDNKVVYFKPVMIDQLSQKVKKAAMPTISPEAAIGYALIHIGREIAPVKLMSTNPDLNTLTYESPSVSASPIKVQLVYRAMDDGIFLAWDVSIELKDEPHWWNVRIDALSGNYLDKNDWTVNCSFDDPNHHCADHARELEAPAAASAPLSAPPPLGEYNVYAFPLEAPSFGARTNLINPEDLSSSPFGWHDDNGVAGNEYTITRGNNVHAYEDANNDNLPGYSPNSATLQFNYPVDLTQAPLVNQDASITNLFYLNNRIHDVLHHAGFTEAAGNFQQNNYGNGGLGNDYVQAEAFDGSGTNNANFGTPADGSRPRMQMYLWTAPNPDRDGSFDNGIVAHEYGHGVSNRLTGGPSNSSCLGNAEQGGEGWSDWLALIMTIEPGDTTAGGMLTQARGIGTYALNQAVSGQGIRRFRYSVNMAINPQTYADLATSGTGPHNKGEIWCDAIWDMTCFLVNDLGYNSDPTVATAGNNIAMRLVLEGMKLQPCSPGFLNARDAILNADAILYGNAHRCRIWEAFARRGMGYSAIQGSANSSTDQTAAFDLPPFCMTATQPPVAAFTSNVSTIACAGTVQFTNTSTQAFNSAWNFGDGGTSILTNPSHQYTSPGTYNVKLVVTNPLGTDSVTHTITVTPTFSATVTATPNPVSCGSSVQLNAAGTGSTNYTYALSTIPFAPVTGTPITGPAGDDIVSSFIPIGFNFPFYNTTQTQLKISTNGFISFNSNSGSGCCAGAFLPNGSTTLSNLIAVAWTDLYVGSPNSVDYFNLTSPNRFVIRYNAVAHCCATTPAQVTAQIILYQTGEIEMHITSILTGTDVMTMGIENANGTAATVVPGRNASNFTASNEAYRFTPAVNYTYNWQPGNLNGASQTVNPTANTTYTVNVADGSGCVTSFSTPLVTVTPLSVSITGNTSFCSGSSTTLNAGAGYSSYNWSNGATTQTTSVNTAGTFTVTVTDANGCTGSASVTTTLNTGLSPSISGATAFCSGSSTTLDAGAGYISYNWSNGATTQTTSVNTAGTFTVTVTDASGCTGSAMASTTVNPLPTATISGTTAICTGGLANLTINFTGAGPWLYAITGSAQVSTSNNPEIVSVTPAATTTYSITSLADANCTGSGSGSATVTVSTASIAPSSISSDASNNNICRGNATSLTVNGGSLGTGANWKWYTGSCGGALAGTGASISVSPISTTTYFARAEGACNNTLCASITITVNTGAVTNLAILPFIGMPAGVCNGTVATLSVPAVSNAIFYVWDAPAGSYFNGNVLNVSPFTTTTPIVTVTFGNPSGSLYTIGVQAGNACGSNIRQSQKVRGTVSVPTNIIGSLTACANTTASYSIPAVTGASSYLWTITGGATVSGTGTTATVTFGPSWNGGTLCVAAKTTCYTSAAKCINISKSAAAFGAISGTFTACPNTTLNYSVPTSAGAASYVWTLPAGATGASSTNNINVSYGAGYNSIGNICVSVTSICGITSAPKCKTVAPGTPTQPSSINGALSGLCSQSTTYNCPSQGIGVSYNWTAPAGATISGNGSTAVSVQFGNFTTGNVCVSAISNCGSSAVRCVPVKGAPNSPGAITATPGSWCANTPGVEFNVNTAALTGIYSLNWSYPAPSVATYIFGGGNSSQLILDWGTGSGNINVTASNACGNGTKTSAWSSTCREGEIGTVSTLTVSPNPTTGIVNVNYTAVKGITVVNVLDLAGRVVMKQSQSSIDGSNTLQLDMSKLAKGAYMLHVQSTQGNKLVKVVVE